MTRIDSTGRVLLLLEEQIRRLGKKDGALPPAAPPRAGTPAPMEGVRALAARGDIADEVLTRALVRGVLVTQLGDAVVNDPAFDAIAGDVIRIIGESDGGPDMIARALRQLGND